MKNLIILTLSFFSFNLYAQTISELETEKTNLKNRLSTIESVRNSTFKDYQSILSVENEQLESFELSISKTAFSKDSLLKLISTYKVSESNLSSYNTLKNEVFIDANSPKYNRIYKTFIKEFFLTRDQKLLLTLNKSFFIQFDVAGRINSIDILTSTKILEKQNNLIKKGKLTLLTKESNSDLIYVLTGVNEDYLLKLDELKIVTDSLELLNSKKSKQENKLKDLTKVRDQKISNLDLELTNVNESIAKIENQINELIKIEIQKKAIANSSKIETVKIGTQIWCTRNLDVCTFRNGDTIPEAKTIEDWEYAGQNKRPAWCYYNFEPSNGTKYGKLYNWYAVNDSRGLAPTGYHVPSEEEWETLAQYLGDKKNNWNFENIAHEKMKSKKGWDSYQTGGEKICPNCSGWNTEYRKKVPCHKCHDTRWIKIPKITKSGNGTNSSGFNALPGGCYEGFYPGFTDDMEFDDLGKRAFWWSSTESETEAWIKTEDGYEDQKIYARYYFIDNGAFASKPDPNKGNGLSVRCVKD